MGCEQLLASHLTMLVLNCQLAFYFGIVTCGRGEVAERAAEGREVHGHARDLRVEDLGFRVKGSGFRV